MDAIDQLALLHKALSGAEQPGHKYKSRKRAGNKWAYDYGDKTPATRNRDEYGRFPKGVKWKKPPKKLTLASIRETIEAAVRHGHSPFEDANRYARSTFSSGALATR